MADTDSGADGAPSERGPDWASRDTPAGVDQLRSDFHAQTARVPFLELQRPFAAGRVVLVQGELDLVDVAIELALDNAQRFQEWISNGAVKAPSDEQAQQWVAESRALWAVVANPWVLVQLDREQA